MTANGANRVLLLYAAASLAAVGLGCAIAATLLDVPIGIWGRNLATWSIGALLALGLIRLPRISATPVLWVLIGLLATTLIGAGIDGVHRWVLVGPVRINLAALLLPAAVVLLPTARWRNIAILAAAALLALQPDASQAAAFAGAALVILARDRGALDWATATGLAALLLAAWLWPDPLQPVAEVEDILEIAWQQTQLLALSAGAALAAAAASPVFARPNDTAAQALTVYIALSAAAPALGAFPVPLVGMTMSPIVGLWLGIGCLAATLRRAAT